MSRGCIILSTLLGLHHRYSLVVLQHRALAAATRGSLIMASKRPTGGQGFGKVQQQPPPQPKPRKRTDKGAVKRAQAATDFDKLKSTGAPEYMVLIRTVGDNGPSKWMPVGGIVVPRSSSEEQALSIAIFNNEDDLLFGAYQAYPKLKNSTDKFEYGYRLKEFPDDPVKVASKESTKVSDNPFAQWFNALDNPLNDGSGWFNPLKKS